MASNEIQKLYDLPEISFIDDITFDEILEEMISDYESFYEEKTGQKITLRPGDKEYIHIRIEAAQYYQMYLKLLPPEAPGRPVVEEILAGLKERAVKQLAGDVVPAGEYAALQQELLALQNKNTKLEKMLVSQQSRLVQLRRKLENKGSGK